jgi:UDP-N-acetylmuramoyl-L-alanyl-D-glutamate--2,6-diaminopimelate ligase
VGEVLRSAGLLVEARGAEGVALSGVTQDSRSVQPGDLFLAWKGTVADAHDFIPEAASRGAVASVVERPSDTSIPQLVVSDGRKAAALVASAMMGFPAEELLSIGVTGTNGKTTTSLLIRHLLAGRMSAAAIGTLGLIDSDGVRPGSERLTTPGPVQIATWLRELVDEGLEAVVIEASSHALEQRRLDGVEFDMVVFTNLSQDHLDYHADVASYFAAKATLVELASNEGAVVVNRDDPAWERLDGRGRRLRSFSIGGDADVCALDLDLSSKGSSFTLVVDGEQRQISLPMIGRFNVENALAAAAVADLVGLSVDEIAEGLETAPPVPGRLEAVANEPFAVLIDFAHSPGALTGVLSAVKSLTDGRLIVVFGAGGDRDRTKRRPMAEAVRDVADVVVLTSDNPRTEDPEQILDDLAEGLTGRAFDRIADRRAAIKHALEMARSGDTVLLAGKGHETYQVIGAEKRPFDERVVVQDCIRQLGAA